MRIESLGKTATSSHHTNLKPDSRPALQHPYLVGLKTRKNQGQGTDRMLREDVAKLAMSERESSGVAALRENRSPCLNVDCEKPNAMITLNTFSLARMEKCSDKLGDADVFFAMDCSTGYR